MPAMTSGQRRHAESARRGGALFNKQIVYVTTQTQFDELDALALRSGRSRAAIVRDCVDRGLPAVRKDLGRSTLTRTSAA